MDRVSRTLSLANALGRLHLFLQPIDAFTAFQENILFFIWKGNFIAIKGNTKCGEANVIIGSHLGFHPVLFLSTHK